MKNAEKIREGKCNKPASMGPCGDREAWFIRLLSFARREMFKQDGDFQGELNSKDSPLPAHIIVGAGLPTTGFLPNRNRKSTTLGQYWHPSCNSKKAHIITINPIINDTEKAYKTFLHELCHAFEPEDSHRKNWQYAMNEIVGITPSKGGKGKEDIREGKEWRRLFNKFVSNNGKYPAADLVHIPHKQQTTRNGLVYCPDNECERYTNSSGKYRVKLNTSRAVLDDIEAFGGFKCPCCGSTMVADWY